MINISILNSVPQVKFSSYAPESVCVCVCLAISLFLKKKFLKLLQGCIWKLEFGFG